MRNRCCQYRPDIVYTFIPFDDFIPPRDNATRLHVGKFRKHGVIVAAVCRPVNADKITA
jgi:hypothetical protein